MKRKNLAWEKENLKELLIDKDDEDEDEKEFPDQEFDMDCIDENGYSQVISNTKKIRSLLPIIHSFRKSSKPFLLFFKSPQKNQIRLNNKTILD